MRNLKKVLSLALALVMMFALVIPATAVDASEYTDWKDVKNQEAVSLLSALDIIAGFPDGTFRGGDSLTRAQVAKMIYVARTGGVDDGAKMFEGYNTFSDTNGHWAEGYINYCASVKIVSGRGDGTFDPDATITGYELMKICLTALNYSSSIEGFEGTFWKSNVAARAKESGLTVGYSSDASIAINRDDTALIFANMIYLSVVGYNADNLLQTGTAEETFGARYLNLSQVKGVLMSNGEYFLGGKARTGEIVIEITDLVTVSGVTTTRIRQEVYKPGFDVKADYLGYAVTMLVRTDSKGDITKFFSVTPTVGANAEISSGTFSPFNPTANAAAGVKYFVNYAEMATTTYYQITNNPNPGDKVEVTKAVYDTLATNARSIKTPADYFGVTLFGYREDKARFIDNNNDGKYDIAIRLDYDFAQINAVLANGNVRIGATEIAPANIIGDVPVKDDIVAYYSFTTHNDVVKYVMEIIEPTTATVTQIYNPATATASDHYVMIDGTKYINANATNMATGNATATIRNRLVTNVPTNKSNTYFLFNGVIVDYIDTSTQTNYAYVIKTGVTGDGIFNSDAAYVALSGEDHKNGTYTLALANDGTVGSTGDTVLQTEGNVYLYTFDAYGRLVLSDTANDAIYRGAPTPTGKYVKGGNVIGGKYVDNKTVAFIQTVPGVPTSWVAYVGIGTIPSYSYSGNALKAIYKDFNTGTANGLGAIVLSGTVDGTADNKYYVVTTNPFEDTINGVTYYSFNANDGSGSKTYLIEKGNTTLSPVVRGGIYTFEFTTSEVVKVYATKAPYDDPTTVGTDERLARNGYIVYNNNEGTIGIDNYVPGAGGSTGITYYGTTNVAVYWVDLGAGTVTTSNANSLLENPKFYDTPNSFTNATAGKVNYNVSVVYDLVSGQMVPVAIYYFTSGLNFTVTP